MVICRHLLMSFYDFACGEIVYLSVYLFLCFFFIIGCLDEGNYLKMVKGNIRLSHNNIKLNVFLN